ncbi:AP3D1 [Symbiodinium sp. KB8]|nr:AP3D1 [Symbiodinium sp. KB8]
MDLFRRSMQDLVKGIRNADDETAYISAAVQGIREDIKSRDFKTKALAVQKLTYLTLHGQDMRWAAFHIIELLTQERFEFKRIGALACALSFDEKTDVLVLCTQQLKRDFQSPNQFAIGLAINSLANIVTPDLAQALLPDVVTMLTSTRPYIRKKATLVLYRMFLAYPEGLRMAFDHLKRRLTDDNPSVLSCAVNVICELARKKPSNYLSLAPDLFKILVGSANNWMLIKVAKLMGSLVSQEPRLARKLLEPLANIIQNTPAKSLMYECINTVTEALLFTKRADGSDAKNVPAVVRLCTDRLRELLSEADQNLKYLGLVGLTKLMRSHPRVVAEHREQVLTCLMDDDVTIRLQALELLTGMVTKRNLVEVITRLVDHVAAAEGYYRDALVGKIIFMCSRDKYAFLLDFAWYVSVLVKLAHCQSEEHAPTIAAQLLDVAVRVEAVRGYAVQAVLPLLEDRALAAASTGTTAEVLFAAAWIVGEYAPLIPDGMREAVLTALLAPTTQGLPAHVQASYVQCAGKVLLVTGHAALAAGDEDSLAAATSTATTLHDRLGDFLRSSHVAVQERSGVLRALLEACGVHSQTPVVDQVAALTALPLKAVSAKAVKRVAVPEGLDLDAPIVPSTAEVWADSAGDPAGAAPYVSFEEAYSTGGEEGLSQADLAGDLRGDSDDDLFGELAGKSSRKGKKKSKKGKKSKKAKKASGESSVFMLGDAAPAAAPTVADIPLETLDIGELQPSSPTSALATSAPLPAAPAGVKYVVEMGDDDSEEDGDGEGGEGGDDALAGIDLTGGGGGGKASRKSKKKGKKAKKASSKDAASSGAKKAKKAKKAEGSSKKAKKAKKAE